MALNFPYLPPNPLRPRAFGGKGAEGMKKEIPSNNQPKGRKRLQFFPCKSNFLSISALQSEAKKQEYRIKDIVRAVAMSELMRKR